jgi:hypothetical protein
MFQKLVKLAAIAVFAFITFATLSPIGLRPATGAVGLERVAAFILLGLLIGLALPGRLGRALVLVVAIAISLEALQLVVPTRHGQIAEAAVKSAGGVVGVSLVWLWELLGRWRARFF